MFATKGWCSIACISDVVIVVNEDSINLSAGRGRVMCCTILSELKGKFGHELTNKFGVITRSEQIGV